MKQNDTAIKISENNRLLSMSNTFVRIDFDLRTTTFSGTDLHTGMAVFNNAEFILDGPASGKQWIPAAVKVSYEYSDIVDVFGQGVRLNLKYVPDSKYKPVRLLAVTLYRTQSFITFGFGVYNPYDRPIRVCRIDMLSGELMPGQELNSPQTLRGGAGAEANFVENGARIDAVNSAMLTGMIGNQRHTVVAGGLHYKEFIRKVSIQEEKIVKDSRYQPGTHMGKQFQEVVLMSLQIQCILTSARLILLSPWKNTEWHFERPIMPILIFIIFQLFADGWFQPMTLERVKRSIILRVLLNKPLSLKNPALPNTQKSRSGLNLIFTATRMTAILNRDGGTISAGLITGHYGSRMIRLPHFAVRCSNIREFHLPIFRLLCPATILLWSIRIGC